MTGKPLTKLQRLGISSILQKYNDKRIYEGGKISFVHNIHGKWYNMFVYIKELIHVDEKHVQMRYRNIIVLTLEDNEDIDTNIEYQYQFDSITMTFHIVEIQL